MQVLDKAIKNHDHGGEFFYVGHKFQELHCSKERNEVAWLEHNEMQECCIDSYAKLANLSIYWVDEDRWEIR
jgi:hypothetical protein